MRYPREWQPDLRVTVRWLVDKKNEKTSGWYKAENVRIEPYITGQTAGVWAIFLAGDQWNYEYPKGVVRGIQ